MKDFKSSPTIIIPRVHVNKDWGPKMSSSEEGGGGTGDKGEDGGPYVVKIFAVTGS
jgi:hypothetical protein